MKQKHDFKCGLIQHFEFFSRCEQSLYPTRWALQGWLHPKTLGPLFNQLLRTASHHSRALNLRECGQKPCFSSSLTGIRLEMAHLWSFPVCSISTTAATEPHILIGLSLSFPLSTALAREADLIRRCSSGEIVKRVFLITEDVFPSPRCSYDEIPGAIGWR